MDLRKSSSDSCFVVLRTFHTANGHYELPRLVLFGLDGVCNCSALRGSLYSSAAPSSFFDHKESDMEFKLSKEQRKKLQEWKIRVAKAGIDKQREVVRDPGWEYKTSWELGHPYTGAIGGGITYCFTPTSLGVSVVVKDQVTKLEIDLTEYEHW